MSGNFNTPSNPISSTMIFLYSVSPLITEYIFCTAMREVGEDADLVGACGSSSSSEGAPSRSLFSISVPVGVLRAGTRYFDHPCRRRQGSNPGINFVKSDRRKDAKKRWKNVNRCSSLRRSVLLLTTVRRRRKLSEEDGVDELLAYGAAMSGTEQKNLIWYRVHDKLPTIKLSVL